MPTCVNKLKPFADYASKHVPKGYELEINKNNVCLWRKAKTGRKYEINMGFVNGEFNFSKFSVNPWDDNPIDGDNGICYGSDVVRAMKKWKSVLGE